MPSSRMVYRLLHALDFSLIPGHLPLERVDVWFQDEARFGQNDKTLGKTE